MAERIEAVSIGRPALYPWAEWMDGGAWRIRRGEDFEVAAWVMAQMIRNRAHREGLLATARVVENGAAVEFQFALEQAEQAA